MLFGGQSYQLSSLPSPFDFPALFVKVDMGVKRPYDDVHFQELPYKHSRQLDCSDKRSPSSDIVSCYNAPEKPYVLGEDGDAFCKSQWLGVVEKYNVGKDSTTVSKGCVIDAPSTLVARSFGEEDIGSGGQEGSPPPVEYFEYDYPRRAFVPFKDDYSSLLDRSPRKQVPIGSNHQARIPSWSGHSIKLDQKDEGTVNRFSLHLTTAYDVDERLLGTTVIPMPDVNLSSLECTKVGQGRKICKCLDAGPHRCVQQHIMEVREELKRTLGNEKFVKLGFCDMGEEVVSRRWSDEEEQAFHDVVYSNPASLGRKFWKHMSAVFPSRSKRELVSYYFNVFMLRRRAVQNRCDTLEIDSDDDEEHGSYGSASGGTVAYDEDSVIESVEDGQVVSPRVSSEEDDSDDDGSDGDGDDYVGCGEDGGMDHIGGESYRLKLVDERRYDTISQNGEKIPGCYEEEFGYQDDSCVSFEFQPYLNDAEPAGGGLQGTGLKEERSQSLRSQDDTSNDGVGHGYLLEPCDAKVWDSRFQMDPMKGIDLLPTWSMIEDIFDQGMGEYKMRDDQKAPASG